MYYELIFTIKLISHIHHLTQLLFVFCFCFGVFCCGFLFCFYLVRTVQFYSLSKFSLHNIVLSAIVTMFYIRSSNLIYLTTKCLKHFYQPFPTFTYHPHHTPYPFPFFLSPGYHHSTLCFSEFYLFIYLFILVSHK